MWNTLATANTYFSTRFGASAVWTALGDPDKTSLLTTAYNRIFFNPDYSVSASASGDTLTKLQMAENELAWYMNGHLSDEDRRKGIQAQGVEEAEIVKEIYDVGSLMELPFPPIVNKLLSEFTTLLPLYASDLTRIEDDSVNT